MERRYPRIRIDSIKDTGKAIIIRATSIQNNGASDFIYKASGRENLPHTRFLIKSNQLREGYEYSLKTIKIVTWSNNRN